MPLVVPILRLGMLALNVYETFKVLKRPPPSQRSVEGRPTIRAQTQRKRDMKGCLSVWIVWCFYATYERTVDSLVGMFVPFYSELKAIVLLFLLLTRARGAEPIYLHIVRPLIKPYESTLDPLLIGVSSFGDLLFLVGTYPIRVVVDSRVAATLRSWWSEEEPQALVPVRASKRRPRQAEDSSSRRVSDSSTRPRSESPSDQRVSGLPFLPNAPADAVQSAFADNLPPGFVPQSQIWYPSASAYAHEGIPEPVEYEPVDEWRQYPAFPSAYPPTPIAVKRKNLPHEAAEPQIPEEEEEVEYAPVEEWRLYPAFPSAYPPTPIAVKKTKGLPSAAPVVPQIEEEEEEAEEEEEEIEEEEKQSEPGPWRLADDDEEDEEPDKTFQPQSQYTADGDDDDEEVDSDQDLDSTLQTPYMPTRQIPRRSARSPYTVTTRLSPAANVPSHSLPSRRQGSAPRQRMSTSRSDAEAAGSSDASSGPEGPSTRKRGGSGTSSSDVRSRAHAFEKARAASATRGRLPGPAPSRRSTKSRAASETDDSAVEENLPVDVSTRRRAVAAPTSTRTETTALPSTRSATRASTNGEAPVGARSTKSSRY